MPERLASRSRRPAPPAIPSRPSSRAAGTVLALDYGERRIGVAVGETELRTAHPLAAITDRGATRMAALARLVEEWHPARLVLGLPVAADGAPHPLARRVREFARQLEAHFSLPVTFVDERYSSSEAEQRLRAASGARRAARAAREREIDAYAAQVLLEQYFAESAA